MLRAAHIEELSVYRVIEQLRELPVRAAHSTLDWLLAHCHHPHGELVTWLCWKPHLGTDLLSVLFTEYIGIRIEKSQGSAHWTYWLHRTIKRAKITQLGLFVCLLFYVLVTSKIILGRAQVGCLMRSIEGSLLQAKGLGVQTALYHLAIIPEMVSEYMS